MDSNISSINNGYWSWDENCNSLVFLSRDPTLTSPSTMKSAGITRSSKQEVQYEVKFYEITDKLEKIILRRYFQRRCRLGEPEVITIQDVKDISTEFINFFHIPTVWEYMLQKRADKSRKLSSLIANELENITSDDLADLRKLEMGRVFRSDFLNSAVHPPRQTRPFKRSAAEDKVMTGPSNRYERKLLQISPLVEELMLGKHDYRMLGIGFTSFQLTDERITYLEAAYTAPEDLLFSMGVRVGILGVSRDDYDPILMHKEKKSKVHYKRQRKLTCFKLLPKVCREVIEVPQTFPTTPCKYQETGQTKLARITQCKMWWKYIKAILEGGTNLLEVKKIASGKLSHTIGSLHSSLRIR